MRPYIRDPLRLRLFNSYRNIRQVCYNPNNALNRAYRRQGLSFESEFASFNEFYQFVLDELGPPPDIDSRIIRKDVNRDFTRSNLEWGTHREQQRRQRRCRNFTYRNETHCVTTWCEILDRSYDAVMYRINKGCQDFKEIFDV